MAGKNDTYQPIELLAPSSQQDAASKGPLAINLFRRRNAWETRDGLGQMAQFDTLLSANQGGTFGYRKILGSVAFKTNFEHVQILTILLSDVQVDGVPGIGNFGPQYMASVFDVTANERHEEVLFIHTAIDRRDENMARASMFWSDEPDPNGQSALFAVDEQISFAEYRDTIIFSGSQLGNWCYRPAEFAGKPMQAQTDSWRGAFGRTSGIPLGESSRITPLVATNGLFPEAYPYLSDMPQTPLNTVLGDWVAYAQGRTVYFAEQGKPASIPATWILAIPSQDEITAIASNNGYLYVWTGQELGIYQPSQNAPVPGALTMMTNGVGCAGQELVERVDSTLMWVAKTGVYRLDSPMAFSRVSDPVRPLFDESISNPLSNFWTQLGGDEYVGAQPRMTWDASDLADATLTWEPVRRMLILSVPAQNYALVYQPLSNGDSWALWNFDSIVQPTTMGVRDVQAKQRIRNLRFHAIDQRLLAVCGLDTTEFTMPAGDPAASTSYVVLEWGRGGGLDRSIYGTTEDDRTLTGYWLAASGEFNDEPTYFVLDKPIEQPAGYLLPDGFGGSTAATHDLILYPVKLCNMGNHGSTVDSFVLSIQNIDTSRYYGTLPAMIFGPERWPSRAGYSTTWVGSALTVTFDGPSVAAPDRWSFWPYLNIAVGNEEPLFWLAFYKKGTTDGVGLGNVSGTLSSINGGANNPQVYVWMQADIRTRLTNEETAQPVDWQFKTAQVGIKDVQQFRLRGMAIRALTRGRSSMPLVADWLHGLLNVTVAADWKDWSGQVLDMTNGGVRIVEKKAARAEVSVFDSIEGIPDAYGADYPMRSRLGVGNAHGTVPNAFNGAAKWGDTGDATKGNTLTGDEDYDTLSISTSVRGEHVSALMFGHIQNKAEKLVLDSGKAFARVVGAFRRMGR